MILGLYTDPHFSQTSSIIVGRKGEFSGRLNNLIQSFSWMNKTFEEYHTDAIFCLGDLTDKPVLTSEEITAMSKCGIEDHYLIVGNHCRSDRDGHINSLAIYPHVINNPEYFPEYNVLCLPYNHTIFDLNNLIEKYNINKDKLIILSHNDIKGYDFGAGHICNGGYDLNDIISNCALFINGHLHNGGWMVKDRAMNLGNLSGINFSSCGGEWKPSIAILNTDTLEIKLIENPYAYIFLKNTFDKMPKVKGFLDNLQDNRQYVIQIKVPNSIAVATRQLISQYSNKITASRVLVYNDNKESTVNSNNQIKLERTSPYEKLRTFIKEQKPKYSMQVLDNIINTISEDQ